MLEKEIQKQCILWLRSDGWKVYKISDRFRAGIPDVYAAKNGKSIWLEIKRPGEKATKLQEYEIKDLIRHGIGACVITSLDQLKQVLHGF